MTIQDIETVFENKEDFCDICEGTKMIQDPIDGEMRDCICVVTERAESKADLID